MAHSPESWEDVETGLTPENQEEKVDPEIDFKVLQHQAFEALEKAHNWEEDGIYAQQARDNLCRNLPGHDDGDYVALVENGGSTEILLAGFESVEGDIYSWRHPQINKSCKLYQTLVEDSKESGRVEEYLEKSAPMDDTIGRDLSFPSEGTVVRLYAPDLEY